MPKYEDKMIKEDKFGRFVKEDFNNLDQRYKQFVSEDRKNKYREQYERRN